MYERDKRAEIYARWLERYKDYELISGKPTGIYFDWQAAFAFVAILSLWEIADAMRELANAVNLPKWRKRYGG